MENSDQPKLHGLAHNALYRALIPLLMVSLLASNPALAQDDERGCEKVTGTPPGLYATTDEGRTFLIQGDKMVELAPGQAAFADKDKLTCIESVPKFLDWPCASDAAQSRKFATYRIDELQGPDIVSQIITRYFTVPEVIEPIPNWLEGESSTTLTFNQIIPYSSPDYWYKPDPKNDILNEKRPKTLLIELFVGINQVLIDNYTVDALHKFYAGQPIPVVFVFNDSNAVPVSYFGANVSLEEINKAFNERHVKLADVPMWPLGDHHFSPTAEEFEKYFDLPSLEEVDPHRREALGAELETYGFSRKPVFVTMLEGGGGKMYVDDPDRVRVALSMGLPRLPSVINFVEQDSILNRCGPGTPTGSGTVSGATTPPGAAVSPPGVTPPAPEPNPSDS